MKIMKIIPSVLLVGSAMLFGVLRARHDSVEQWDATSTVLLAGIIIAWLLVSRILLRFIDARNRSRKLAGFAGFVVFLATMFTVGWIAFRLKCEFSQKLEFSASFRNDGWWLGLFPLFFYLITWGKKPSQQTEPAPTSDLAQQ